MTAPTVPTLYPDQQRLLAETRAAVAAGHKRILMVAPTGSGKGTLSTYMIHSAVGRGRKVLFLVNRRELVKDQSRRLDRLGIDHGIIMADHPRRRPWLGTHIASVDTLRNRIQPKADLIFVDEAHLAISDSWVRIIEKYPDAVVVGMTATPIRLDGKGLGTIFEAMVQGPTCADLIASGRLATYRAYAPSAPDLTGVRKSAGDYNQKQLAAAVDKNVLVGDIVQHWLEHGRGRPTVAFCCTVAHAEHVCDQFKAKGIRAVAAHASTPDEERDRIWRDLATRQVDVVTSVGIISYGWDVPEVSCAILARPTESLALYLQQVGRGLRVARNKQDLLILDHAGNIARHGLPDDPREWSLKDGVIRQPDSDKAMGVAVCRNCYLTYRAVLPECPECGAERPKIDRTPQTVDGSLVEIAPRAYWRCSQCGLRGSDRADEPRRSACPKCYGAVIALATKYDTGNVDAQRRKYEAWCEEAEQKGFNKKYPDVKFKAVYGTWPPKQWKLSRLERDLRTYASVEDIGA